MEYYSNSHQEESINSSEEVDHQDNDFDNLGVGRLYECVFCKRGFNSAQALGGHMNIHRKNKPRNHKASPRKPGGSNYTGPRLYNRQIPESRNGLFEHQYDHIRYATNEYAGCTCSAARVPLYDQSHNDGERLQHKYRRPRDYDGDTNQLIVENDDPKEELDLELRL